MSTSSPLGGGPHEPQPPHAHQPGPYGNTATTTTTAGGAPGASTPKSLALAALIVGIVAFLTGLVPVFGAIVGIAAIVLAALALRKRQPKALAVTGLALGAVAVVASILVTAGIGAVLGGAADEPIAAVTPTPDEEAAAPSTTPDASPAPSVSPSASAPADSDVPPEYAAALEVAETRAVSLRSSKAVTYAAIISSGASAEAADYAIEAVGVDWKENALLKAKQYRDGGMPVETIHDQLTSEYGEAYTVEEADYAMAALDG
ncbi:Ltp family lipoprotein [Frigoribacterium faeni]|uniref:Ltp family lipoprotein n=1 Tax=Frigoribacterium faeni TaxID=145483 RepID=UPI00141AAD26|nr:Ltp family lipoprotein [Frigoribacterium faeni]NIJ06293.1 hypothetical protein [Frigoribacterium faeni]